MRSKKNAAAAAPELPEEIAGRADRTGSSGEGGDELENWRRAERELSAEREFVSEAA